MEGELQNKPQSESNFEINTLSEASAKNADQQVNKLFDEYVEIFESANMSRIMDPALRARKRIQSDDKDIKASGHRDSALFDIAGAQHFINHGMTNDAEIFLHNKNDGAQKDLEEAKKYDSSDFSYPALDKIFKRVESNLTQAKKLYPQ